MRRERRCEFEVWVAVGVQPVVSEGSAQVAADLMDGAEANEVVAEQLRPLGIDYDPAVGAAVARAERVLSDLSTNVALLHDAGAGRDELLAYQRRWLLQPEDRVERTVDSLERRPFPAYVFCYTEGRALCTRFVRDDPRRFERLLKEQLSLDDLLS